MRRAPTSGGCSSTARRVIVVRERDTAGGFLENRFKTINRLLNSEPNAIWLNQYENIANKQVHAEQTANEIAREFEHVDWIFIGAGTTGTLGGVSERLREVYPNIGSSPSNRRVPSRWGAGLGSEISLA